MLISCTTGFENFTTAAAKNYVFVVPSEGRPGKEVHIGIAAKSGHSGVRITGAPQHFPAAPGFREETGRWTTANYELSEGTILKILGQRTGDFGHMRVMASLLLRHRATAAYIRVGTILTGNPNAAFSRVWVEGRFDILTLEQARTFGVHVPPHFAGTYDETMTRRAFEIVEVERALATPAVEQVQTVQNSAGEQVEVRVVRRARALDL